MTPPGRGDRDHLFDAVLVRVAGHLGTAGSTCPHVPSVTEDMEAPASSLSTTLSYISIILTGCCNLGGYPESCMLIMTVLLDMHTVSSGLASCRHCNAVAASAQCLVGLLTSIVNCIKWQMQVTQFLPCELHAAL